MRAVLFDIDGTLLHSAAVDDALYREAVRAVLGDVQLRATLHEYEFVTDSGVLRQILHDNDIDENESTLVETRSVFVGLLRAHISQHGPFAEIPGAGEMLRALQETPGYAVAMATGGWRQSAELKLASAGMHYRDIPLATSNDHYERATIMEIALARLGSDFESVTYYGDGPWDREACLQLGWEFVAVGPELDGLEDFRGVDPCS